MRDVDYFYRRIIRNAMMKGRLCACLAIIISHFSLLTPHFAIAQVGTWRNYLAYYNVENICAADQYLFVLASNSLYQYNQNDQSITTYDKVNGLSDTYITHIGWSKAAKRLIAIYKNSNIDLIDANGNITNISSLYTKSMTEDKTVSRITIDGVYAWLHCPFGYVKVNMQKAEIAEIYTQNNPEYPSELPDYDEYKDYNEYKTLVSTLNPGGPKYNYFGFLKYDNDRLYSCGGGSNNINLPGCVQILKDGDWTIYQDEGITEKTGLNYINTNCLDYDPNDISHVFVASRCGVYEFRNEKFVAFYNDENSPIESFNGTDKYYELIYGLKFDKKGNLWMLNSSAPTQSVIEYTSSGEFVSHYVEGLMKYESNGYKKSNPMLKNISIDSHGYFWFVNNNWILPAAYRYNIDDNSIIEYSHFVNQDGTIINGMYGVSCTAEDKNGDIWIGTDVGPFVLEKSQIESSSPVYTQVKVPRNDGSNYADYLLNKVNITAIAIDAGNRKWIGTNGDGVYLISADNMTQIYHFSVENSKLLSNVIQSIAINGKSGEVFFGTDNGLCSFMSDATAINDEMTKDNVWAYPNPVTPDYNGLITVVGLSYNADVKIVSSNGALIAEGRSNGGSFTWDGNDKNGKRVASGVYMVITATEDGKKGTVCKIAIVN